MASLLSSAEAASDRTGEDLVKNYARTHPAVTDDHAGIYCLEYISGFTDSMWLVTRVKGHNSALFCLPYDLTVGKAVEAVMNYAKTNPDSKREHISMFTTRALQAAFPCP